MDHQTAPANLAAESKGDLIDFRYPQLKHIEAPAVVMFQCCTNYKNDRDTVQGSPSFAMHSLCAREADSW